MGLYLGVNLGNQSERAVVPPYGALYDEHKRGSKRRRQWRDAMWFVTGGGNIRRDIYARGQYWRVIVRSEGAKWFTHVIDLGPDGTKSEKVRPIPLLHAQTFDTEWQASEAIFDHFNLENEPGPPKVRH